MKKIIISLFCIISLCSCKYEDPFKYKGCVVVNKYNAEKTYNVQIKLTETYKEEVNLDYMWICVPKYELDKLNIGDTIK